MARMIKAKIVRQMLAEGRYADLKQWVDSQRVKKVGPCVYCGTRYAGKTVKRMYCSTACKQAEYRRRKKENER